MSLYVKICGVTNPVDAAVAVEAGADAVGVIFARSPRQVALTDALAIRDAVPDRVEMAGVFVDPTPEALWDAVVALRLGVVQLHRDLHTLWGEETWDAILDGLQERGTLVAQAIRARDAATLHTEIAGRLNDASRILLDAYVPGREGGTGQTFDWSLVEIAKTYGRPVIVAGGLTPENVAEAVRRTRPWGVDVSSGVEAEPGRKDHDAVRRFISAARSADAGITGAVEASPAW